MTATIINLAGHVAMRKKARHTIGTAGALSHALAESDYKNVAGFLVPPPREHGYMTEREMQRVARRLRLLHTAAERKDLRARHVDYWDAL